MIGIEKLFRIIFPMLLLFGVPASLVAQSDVFIDPGKTAQSKSEEEFDKYLDIVTASDPQQIIDTVNAFVSQFPQSELLPAAYRYQMHAFEHLNDFSGMLTAGRKALAGNPDNVNILLSLAAAMASRAPGRADQDALLSQAENDARHALEEIDKTRISRKISAQEWTFQKHQMQSEAHGIFGVVALQRKQAETAVHEFMAAIDLAPQPQGIQFLRLGLAYSSAGDNKDAQENFRHAADLGPEPVRKSASAELKKLSESTAPQ
jgi:tetratricopeptide (TPR) repeat protein